MRLRLLYTATLTLCMSALASSNECARHTRQTVKEERSEKVIPLAKPLVTEKESPMEYSSLLLTLYV
jgi:hypothetical protein